MSTDCSRPAADFGCNLDQREIEVAIGAVVAVVAAADSRDLARRFLVVLVAVVAAAVGLELDYSCKVRCRDHRRDTDRWT